MDHDLNKHDQEITFINKMDDNHFMSVVEPSRADVYAYISLYTMLDTPHYPKTTTPPNFFKFVSC